MRFYAASVEIPLGDWLEFEERQPVKAALRILDRGDQLVEFDVAVEEATQNFQVSCVRSEDCGAQLIGTPVRFEPLK